MIYRNFIISTVGLGKKNNNKKYIVLRNEIIYIRNILTI